MPAKRTNEQFLLELSNILPHIIPLEPYKTSRESLNFKCTKHNFIFRTFPDQVLHGKYSCKECIRERQNLKQRKSFTVLQEELKQLHPHIVICDEYYNNKTPLKCYCTQGQHYFYKDAHHLLRGQGCPICSSSSGEQAVISILNQMNVKFVRQYKFEDCCDINPLPFDFFLPDWKIAIEYQGEQHYIPSTKFGMTAFLNTQKHDKIKQEYCLNHNIDLIIISYKERTNLYKILQDRLTSILNCK